MLGDKHVLGPHEHNAHRQCVDPVISSCQLASPGLRTIGLTSLLHAAANAELRSAAVVMSG